MGLINTSSSYSVFDEGYTDEKTLKHERKTVKDAKKHGWKENDGLLLPPERFNKNKRDESSYITIHDGKKVLRAHPSIFTTNERRYDGTDPFKSFMMYGGMIDPL